MTEAGYEKVFGEGQTALVVLDAETWDIVDANPAAQSFYGWSLDDMRNRGLNVLDISQTDIREVKARLQMVAKGEIARFEGTQRVASGELRDVEVYCGPVSVGGGGAASTVSCTMSASASAPRRCTGLPKKSCGPSSSRPSPGFT